MLTAGVSDDVAFALILLGGEMEPNVSSGDNITFEGCCKVEFALTYVHVNVVERKHRVLAIRWSRIFRWSE